MKRCVHAVQDEMVAADAPAFFVWANAKGCRREFDDNCLTLLPGRPKIIARTADGAGVSAISLCDLAEKR